MKAVTSRRGAVTHEVTAFVQQSSCLDCQGVGDWGVARYAILILSESRDVWTKVLVM
jgi:hypothetical protein